MARTRRWGAFGLTLLVVLAGPCDAVAATERLSVVVNIDDRAYVPAPDLAGAKVEVERVFQAARVEIAWVEGRLPVRSGSHAVAGPSRPFSVTLANNLEAPSHGATGCALGLAAPALTSVYVFYNRIIETSRLHPIDVRVVLGRVIAHELGHLLLPPVSHSRYGIMRADLDLGFRNPARFTDDEARRIRTGIAIRSLMQ
jgi:hypothetical protein